MKRNHLYAFGACLGIVAISVICVACSNKTEIYEPVVSNTTETI